MEKIEKFVKNTHTDEANNKRRLTMINKEVNKGKNHPRWNKNFNIDDAVRLFLFEGKSLREISKELNIPRTTLHRRLKLFVNF
jgi:hypothetical protein